MDSNYFKSHAGNNFLSHKQVVQHKDNLRKLYQEQRILSFNLAKKNIRLNKSLEIPKRYDKE